MKSLTLSCFVVLCCLGMVQAQRLSVSLGVPQSTLLKLWVPPQDASIVELCDVNHDMALMTGAETTFGQIANTVDLSIGGVISETGKGTPYGSLGYTITDMQAKGILQFLGFQTFNFGIFAGYDFSLKSADFWKDCRVGLKIGTPILSN